MLIRFRSKDGMYRVSCEGAEKFGVVLERLLPQLKKNIDLDSFSVSDGSNGKQERVGSIVGVSIDDLNLKHGDIVYLSYQDVPSNPDEQNNAIATANSNMIQETTLSGTVKINPVKIGDNANVTGPLKVKELLIDEELEKRGGLIPRTRSQLCKHGDKGMCEYCSPLPPWDKEYHEQKNIKHISFHSFLKKLNADTNKSNGSSYMAPLSQLNFKIDKKCRNGHEPWPRGICSKCQPSAITLKQQEFRMVDHVEFQKSELINEFIESWRFTGMQRIGYMYGSYQEYNSTPLGIKAVVEAIYEPAQHDEQDGLTMDMAQVKEEMMKVDKLAELMGLKRIGFIFTDLTDAGNGDGTVFCKRHKDSYFLTSFETIMAARHQLDHPNTCRYSEQGYFSSKFVTSVISGNLEGVIDISSYQVSVEAEALVDATMISGSTHPSMSWINDTTNERYVPELFYMKKNEYGLTVKENAKPAFPVDYLLVSLSHGFPKDENANASVFKTISGFPWTNRESMGQSQDYEQLKKYIYEASVSGDFNLLRSKLSNFHFLLYVHSLDILGPEEWNLLVRAATTTDEEGALFQLVSSGGWQTLIMILQESV